jgi:uncharacterized membrane protein YeaQ/YmgE (transglycosylase-associated protein family)
MFDSAATERASVNPREAAAKIRTGIICNPKSHRNRSSVEATKPFLSGTVLAVTPRTQDELAEVLTDFARHGIELLVIDGGDGTIRDVMTAAARVWTGAAPRVAIVPSGKTNALALDLGIPDSWTLDQALTAADAADPFSVSSTTGSGRFRVLAVRVPGAVDVVALSLHDVDATMSRLRWVLGAAIAIVIGILGAVLGGFITRRFFGANLGNNGLIASFGVALLGSCIVIFVWKALRRRSA